MRAPLTRLLSPHSIAVVGGGVWCAAVIQQCIDAGFEGPIWPVHPTKSKLSGLKTYQRVEDLPAAPDATFIGVNRVATIDVVKALDGICAGGAVCFASGFLEASAEDEGAAGLQKALLDACGDLALLGPNCYGFLNYLDGVALWPDQHGGRRVESGVAILTQSSNIAINLTMQQRGLPIAYVVTLGNQAKVNMAEVGLELLDDPRVTALGCHVEGFGDLRAFEALARKARSVGKPIVVLKVGRSAQAQMNTISHTASLAGSDSGAQAFIERLGVGRADTLYEFIETLKLLHVFGPLPGTATASLSCSGGEASLMADAGDMLGIDFPGLTENQSVNLRETLGPKVALSNPLDYHTYIWHDAQALEETFTAMTGAHIDITFLVLDFPRNDRCDPAAWESVLAPIEGAAGKTGRRFSVLASLPETMPEHIAARLLAKGIAPMVGIEDALKAVKIAHAAVGGEFIESEPVLQPAKPAQTQLITEHEAKRTLAGFGMKIPSSGRAKTPQEAAKTAQDIGFPVVLKGEGLAHKSEHAAVILNIQSAEDVMQHAENIPCESFLVEQMIADSLVELLVGVVRDDAHGLLLILAAGGIYAEILQDRQTLLLPVTTADVDQALSKLKIAPLLAGYRGRPSVDRNALIDSIMALQKYALSQAHNIEEVEINPLICREHDAVVADALIRANPHS